MTGIPHDRRLTCNRVFRHLMYYSQRGFSGRLDIQSAAVGTSWSIYMHEGRLFWATGGHHPKRRWRRQLCLATGKKPDLGRLVAGGSQPCWDYFELQRLTDGILAPKQVSAIVQGMLSEVLFDIVQAFELPLAPSITKYHQPLLPLSELVGVGDGMQIIPASGEIPASDRLPIAWMPSAFLLQRETQAAWEQWVCLGLLDASPDSAPIVNDVERLRHQTSAKAFQNLTALLNGKRTFRDIALKMKRGKDQFGVGSALAPYIHQKLVGFQPISDLTAPVRSTNSPQGAGRPSVLCIESVYKNHSTLEALAERAGYAYTAMADGIEALYALNNPQIPVPDLILIAEGLAVLSAPEICQIVRRIGRLQSIPLVVYSEEPRSSHVVQRTLQAGATDYLCGEEFSPQHLLALFERCDDTVTVAKPASSVPDRPQEVSSVAAPLPNLPPLPRPTGALNRRSGGSSLARKANFQASARRKLAAIKLDREGMMTSHKTLQIDDCPLH